MSPLGLYTYCRSSAAYRVRIALNYKGLTYEPHYVHLVNDGGQHLQPAYRAVNPQALVPTLRDGEQLLSQSLAIIEYLEEKYPRPHLLPSDMWRRAQARSLALAVACDIHPLNNLRVLRYLQQEFGVDEQSKQVWYGHWISEGFTAIEEQLARQGSGPFCLGDMITLADVVLVPQVYNAKRFNCSMDPFPRIMAVYDACMAVQAFRDASPQSQQDYGDPN